jgi:hypothetical protein
MLVRERESVHIQTGERFIIPAHHKLSFIPDKEMKDNINRPFAFLEPVEADELPLSKDIVDIEDEEYIEDAEETEVGNTVTQELPELDEDIIVPETSFTVMQENDIEIKRQYYDIISPVISIDRHSKKNTTETIGNVFETEVKSAISEQKVDDSGETLNNDDNKNANIVKKIPLWMWFILLPLLIIIGVGIGTYAFLHFSASGSTYNNLDKFILLTTEGDTNIQEPLPLGSAFLPDSGSLSSNMSDTTQQQVATSDAPAINNADSAKEKEKKPIDWLAPTSAIERKEGPKRAEKPNKEIERKNRELLDKHQKAEEAKKAASSAQTTKIIPGRIRMSQGSSLRDIALEHYGDKVFWVYIYEYNKNIISNYNKVPAGTELRLPSPKSYDIDPRSQESVERAYRIQSELYKRESWDDYIQ